MKNQKKFKVSGKAHTLRKKKNLGKKDWEWKKEKSQQFLVWEQIEILLICCFLLVLFILENL